MQIIHTIRHLLFFALGVLCSLALPTDLHAQRGDQREYVEKLPIRASEASGVTVTVVDRGHEPIAGIDVLIMPDQKDPRVAESMKAWREKAKSIRTEHTDETAAQAAMKEFTQTYFTEFVLRYQTNAEGVVTVLSKGSASASRKGGTSTTAIIEGKAIELVWSKDVTIRVQAVNAKGKPVRGISLSLAQANSYFRSHGTRRKTDKQGFATLTLRPHQLREKRMAVTATMLTRTPVEFVFDPTKPETIPDPIRLEIPAYGKLRVYVRNPKGDLVAKLSSAELWLDAAQGRGVHRHVSSSLAATKIDGDNATFDFVGVGIPVRATLWTKESKDAFTLNGKGPSFPHEMVVLTYEGVRASPKIKVRVLGLGQSVLKKEKVFVVFSRPGSYSYEEVTTDEDGRLEIMVRNEFSEGRMHIVRRGANDTRDSATEYLGSFRTRELDFTKQTTLELGDVQLSKAPILAAGIVVDTAGKPIEGVSLHSNTLFYALPDNGGMGSSGSGSFNQHQITRSDGRFEFRENGETPPSVPLSVTKDGYAMRDPQLRIDGDAKSLHIVLLKAATVRASFAAFPEGIERWPGDIKLWSADHDYSQNLRTFQPQSRSRALTEFAFSSVPTGRYRCGLFVPGQLKPSFVIEGIEVADDGTVTDEMLKAIDWSEVGTFHQLEFVDPDGEALDRDLSVLQYWGRGNDGYSGSGIRKNKAGRYVAILPKENAWVGAHHPRFQTIEVRPPVTAQRFVMKPKPKVTVEITNLPKLGKLKLRPEFRRQGKRLAHVRFMNDRSFRFLSDTKLEAFAPSAGKFELKLQVQIPTGKNRYQTQNLQNFEFEVKQGAAETKLEFTLTEFELEQFREWKESLSGAENGKD